MGKVKIVELKATDIAEIAKDFEAILTDLKSHDVDSPYHENVETWIEEYKMKHEIFNRSDKQVGKDNEKRTVVVAKLGAPFQKKIVNSAVSFLFGEPVKLINNNDEEKFEVIYDAVKDVWKNAKLDFHNRKIARKLFVETRAAELFYVRIDQDNVKKVKVKVLCKSEGDDITPHWDDYGDMDAFIREYQWKDEDGKDRHRVEIYTDEIMFVGIKAGDNWSVQKYDNLIGKIPVIYYEQEENEWEDLQSLIERVETMISNNADTNDYFGSPAIVSKGMLKNAPEKGEVGKFFEILPETVEGRINYGELSYLTWDRAPEGMKTEYEILKDLIYSMSQTPDLSFNNVKGTSNLSGIALKFMFLDSILKSRNKQEIFGECLDRRINLLSTIIGTVTDVKMKDYKDLDISVEFQDGLPENLLEIIDMLVAATAGEKVMSQEAAVHRNPLIDDPESELDTLKKETETQAANNPPIPESYE